MNFTLSDFVLANLMGELVLGSVDSGSAMCFLIIFFLKFFSKRKNYQRFVFELVIFFVSVWLIFLNLEETSFGNFESGFFF